MKKIINRKLYDTETAELVLTVNRSFALTHYLYKTEKGTWFRVTKTVLNPTEFTVLSVKEARQYIMDCDAELYIKLFGYKGIKEA